MNTNCNIDLLSESDLWQLVQNDHQAAFNAVYTKYWSALYQTAFYILKDREQSLDIVQEIFVWLWEHRKSVQIKTTLKGYLTAAVKFKAANLIRGHKVRADFFKYIETASPFTLSTDAALQIEAKELQDVILQTVDSLPERCGAVYKLSRNEHLSNQEIAQKLGVSIKTVENQMTIALKKLRLALSQFFVSITFFVVSLFL